MNLELLEEKIQLMRKRAKERAKTRKSMYSSIKIDEDVKIENKYAADIMPSIYKSIEIYDSQFV